MVKQVNAVSVYRVAVVLLYVHNVYSANPLSSSFVVDTGCVLAMVVYVWVCVCVCVC